MSGCFESSRLRLTAGQERELLQRIAMMTDKFEGEAVAGQHGAG